jgi:hypothetical protein
MYEMQRPRPVSQRRPADFSASLRRSTTYRGQQPASVPVAQITGWLGTPPGRVARELPFTKTLGFPKAQRLQVFSRAVAQSFLFAT